MTELETSRNVNEDLQNENDAPESPDAEIDTDSREEANDKTADFESDDGIDYAAVVEEDIKILREEFRELANLSDICELNDPMRYAALRDLGLSPIEAYLATAKRQKRDNRSHLVATRTVSAAQNGTMSDAELSAAREIFVGIPDSEIRKLYKRVTK